MELASGVLGSESPVNGSSYRVTLRHADADGFSRLYSSPLRPCRQARASTLNSIFAIPSTNSGQGSVCFCRVTHPKCARAGHSLSEDKSF